MNRADRRAEARYIDADKLCEGLKNMASVQEPYKQSTILGVVSSIENFPTADVAPRTDVAREIFEELRRYIINHCYLADDDVDAIWKHIDMLEKKYTKAEPPKEKQPKCSENSENFEKQRLLPGDCFHGEIWYMCPYCFTGIEAHSIPKDRICHKCGKEYL